MRDASPSSSARALRFLCTQNPFYVISAVLVLYGLRQCAVAGGELTGGWLLMIIICGYTLLMALAACVIIRFGRVWDDARTILLVLVLLFLALSVSFDKIALVEPLAGAWLLLVGFAFSVFISECLLTALHLRLSPWWRGPYYLSLALLFGYPLVLAVLSVEGYNRPLSWGVYLFPWLAGGAVLTLLPAARWGHRDRRPNGTPWRWPLYPWTLFIFLWVCLMLRSYSLSVSFEAAAGLHAQFQPHFLAPLLLAAAMVLLEVSLATRNRTLQQLATLAPAGVVVLALVGNEPTKVNVDFLPLFCATIGSPAQIALACLIVFYAIAWLRRVRMAEAGLAAAILMCSLVDRNTVSVTTLATFNPLPLDVVAVFLVANGIGQAQRWKAVAGGLLLVGTSAYRDGAVAYQLATVHSGYLSLHVVVLALLLAALLSEKRWADTVRRAALVFVPLAAWLAGATYDALYPGVLPRFHLLYIAGLTAIAWGYWHREQLAPFLAASLATSTALGLVPLKRLYVLLQSTLIAKALPWLTVGLLLLALALLISLYKGGPLRRLWPTLRRWNERLRSRAAAG